MKLVDWQIASLQTRRHVIEPFEGALVRELPGGPALPFGLAHDGYILRLSSTSAVANFRTTVDPKYLPKPNDTHGLNFIPPQSCMMALTMENVAVPPGYTGRLELTQQYSLCGLQMVPMEMIGGVSRTERIMITLINPMAVPIMLYPGEGICKLVLADEAPLEPRGEQRSGAGLMIPEGGGGDGANA